MSIYALLDEALRYEIPDVINSINWTYNIFQSQGPYLIEFFTVAIDSEIMTKSYKDWNFSLTIIFCCSFLTLYL